MPQPSTAPGSHSASATAHPCAECGRATRGRFCAHCGAVTEPSTCVACGGELLAGDRHCSQCGASVGGAGTLGEARASRRTAWTVAGIAFAALILTVVLQKASDRRASDAAAIGDVVPAGSAPAAGGPPSAQELANMSPRQMLDRLYDRIMRLKQEGKQDSVQFFAPMVLGLYDRQELQPLDADLRYDLGTIANAAGELTIERAQADTILQQQPTHLLGLAMAARNARARGDAAAAKKYDARLIAAQDAESKANRPEYQRHSAELEAAIGEAKKP